MGWLKRHVTIEVYIAPARAIPSTGKDQRVIFALLVNAQL
jgi:hypothetical protein